MKKMITFGLVLALTTAASQALSSEVNVYSARKEALIKPLLDRFSEETGISVNLVTGKADALLKRLKSEGANSPADLLITTDAGRLHRARSADVLQPVNSDTLNSAIPASYRDPEGYWHGLSVRARVITYIKDKVNPADLSRYEDLADPKWKGRICIRGSGNIYNQSLVASLLEANGEEATQSWANGLVENMARKPKGGDRDQIRAAAAGVCDLAIVNTYYLGAMLNSDDEKQREAAAKVAIYWPNQNGRGAHVNVSGAGVTRSAKHRNEAIRLLEFLVNEDSQAWYARVNHEYPVRQGVEWSDTLRRWGKFKADDLNLSRLGTNNPEAVRLMDRAGWK